MTTYREVFANREFRALFGGNAAAVAGKTMEMLALATLVFAATGSPLLAAVAYLAGFAPQALGAATLLSLADRVPPRAFLAGWSCVWAAVAAVLATGVLPVWGMFVLVLTVGMGDAVAGAARTALLADVLGDGYVLGRSLLNITVGAMQIVGFAVGGVLLAAAGPRPVLAGVAALALLFAGINRFGLTRRAPRATGRASVAQTWRGSRELLAEPRSRALLLAQWLPNGLIVGAEALYVPYAGDAAGLLFTAAAFGMLVGDVVVGRWVPRRLRQRLVVPMLVLLAVPYLAFAARPGPVLAAALVAVASVGFAAHLGVQERFLEVVPERLRGHAFGLAGSGMMTGQAVAATLTGTLAEAGTPALAMTAAAVASLLTSAALVPALRAAARPGTAPAPEPRSPSVTVNDS